MITLAGDIKSNYLGFQIIIDVYHQMLSCGGPVYEVDMSRVNWLDANMCAPLGAIFYLFNKPECLIELNGLKRGVENILHKNGFWLHFGVAASKKQDTYDTTIEYKRFDRTDARSFQDYVASHFVGKRKGMPEMSKTLRSRFRESIYEILENAAYHSETQYGIFACGQQYPDRGRLDFTIADLGVGMRETLRKKIGLDLSSEKAIEWAVAGENTTRRRHEGKPGGLGLKLIKEFIMLNQGRFQIVSDAGYWCYSHEGVELRKFSEPFPGTVVNIEINTSDTQSYCLESEVDPNSIF